MFTVPVTEEQLSLILTTLQYDGVMENAPGSEDEDVWRLVKYKIPNETAFTSFPCGVCPVSHIPSSIFCMNTFDLVATYCLF